MVDHRGPFGRRGFSLIEMMVVVLIIGILAAFAVPAYLKSVETSKADDAVSLMNMVATTNRMYALDHNNVFTTGSLTSSCSGSCPLGTATDPCNLVVCKYLAAQDFDSKPYTINAADGSTTASCLGQGSGKYVACVSRKTSGAQSTSISPYTGWGYTVDVVGVVTPYGAAPTPVQ